MFYRKFGCCVCTGTCIKLNLYQLQYFFSIFLRIALFPMQQKFTWGKWDGICQKYISPFIFNSADHKVAFRSFGLGTRVALNYPTCRSLTLGLCQLLSMTHRPSYKHHSKCTLCPYFDVFGVLCNLRCVYIYILYVQLPKERYHRDKDSTTHLNLMTGQVVQ